MVIPVPQPKKQALPLFLLLLSFFVLFFLFTNSHSYRSLTTSDPDPTLFPEKLTRNPHSFTFFIKVLTYNRLQSLSRCLRSLAAADYGGSTGHVHLHVYIDHFPLGINGTDVDTKLDDSRTVLEFVDAFEWRFGDKFVHYRTDNAGLQAQWLEAWWPSSDHEFAFVVEDDLELSPMYYKFLESVIMKYYYNASNYSPSIYGASLQRPRFVPGKHGNKIQLDSGTHVFLYQLVGTWGQLLFPKPWKEFRFWYDIHKGKSIKPFLDGMVTNGWYKKLGERIWTPWFIKFIHTRGYFNIYTNFMHERALSVSHRDAGVNYGKTAGPDSELLDKNTFDLNSLKMQPLDNLKWYDFCFKEAHLGRVVKNLDELGTVIHSVQTQDTVILLSLFGVSEAVARNLLCHFERLNTQNYIIIGPHSDLLDDLSRRGHPVVDADQFLEHTAPSQLKKYQDIDASQVKELVVKAYVIKKCLEYGYSSWVMNGNMIFDINLLLKTATPTYDFYTGKNPEFVVVRSSSSSKKIWTDVFISALLKEFSSSRENQNFAHTVSKVLEHMDVKFKIVDDANYAVNIGSNSIYQSSELVKKIVYWPAKIDSKIIEEQLEELNLWIIDSDFSCKAVICHQS